MRVNYTFESTVLVITGCLIKIEAIGSEYSNLVQVPLCMECRGTKNSIICAISSANDNTQTAHNVIRGI